MKEIIYFWYDHLLLRETGEADIVEKAIKKHDFDTFMRIKEKYDRNEQGWCFFPDFAAVYDGSNRLGEIDITDPENFAKITYSEYECG